MLVAVGRKPNAENIGLETTRAALDRGFIKVDQYQRTAEPGVYAIGDVVAGTPQLAHVATKEGLVAVAHIAGKPVQPINRRSSSPPPPTPSPASAASGSPKRRPAPRATKSRVGKFSFMPNSMASILGRHDGFVKVVSDEKYGEILGVHIIGPLAWE